MTPLVMQAPEFASLAHVASRVEFFSSFIGAQLDIILSRIRLYAYADGEIIFHRGDAPVAFFMIHEGHVALIFKPRFFGLLRTVITLEPGQFFGEMALLKNEPRTATAEARGPVKLFVLLKEEFDAIVRQNPSFAEKIRHIAAQRRFEMPH